MGPGGWWQMRVWLVARCGSLQKAPFSVFFACFAIYQRQARDLAARCRQRPSCSEPRSRQPERRRGEKGGAGGAGRAEGAVARAGCEARQGRREWLWLWAGGGQAVLRQRLRQARAVKQRGGERPPRRCRRPEELERTSAELERSLREACAAELQRGFRGASEELLELRVSPRREVTAARKQQPVRRLR